MTDLPASNQKDSELCMTVNALYNGSAAVCDFQTRNKTLFLIKQKKKKKKKKPCASLPAKCTWSGDFKVII